MKVLRAIFFCFLCYVYSGPLRAQSISVDDTQTASALVNLINSNNSCITIINENVSGDNFSPRKNSYGTFTNTSPNFPFQSGIVLSTWSSTQSEGPFVENRGGGGNNWLGDDDLDEALSINSINATVLEFDFIPLTNTISFNYIFASNEYQDNFPCEYSDGFAFLIKEKESTAAYQNIAVIPNTTIPVSSSNIHPAISFNDDGVIKSCDASNESYFEQFNTAPTNNSPINYAGQTKVLNAIANVTVGTVYHIKLVIADDRFDYYDSAVFIEAASLNAAINLGNDKLVATNTAVCFGEDFIIDTQLPTNYSYKWYKNGIEIPLENNPTYTVKTPGIYTVEANLHPTSCTVFGKIAIEYTSEIILKNSSLTQCDIDEDGKSVFDLTQADLEIQNNTKGLSQLSYYESLSDAISDSNPILNKNNYSNTSNPQILIAKATDSNNCYYYAELTLELSNDIIPDRLATITNVTINDFAGNQNSASIEYSGSSDYEFSIDGIFYQDSPLFFAISPGAHIAYTRDKNGCGISNPFPFYILDYPRYFTPNGDGYNDTWTITNLNQLPQARTSIFDRYGKLLKQFNTSNLSWNGTLNGQLLPADDYWFHLIFSDGREIKGHFSLKR